MTNRIAWLIERSGLPNGPVYLTVAINEWKFEWTSDHDSALQYPTKEEAERAWRDASRGQPVGDAMSNERIRITEHEWVSAPNKIGSVP